MRILLGIPVFPFPPKGAAEHDCRAGIDHLHRLGHDLRVIAFLPKWQDPQLVHKISQELNIPMRSFPLTARAVGTRAMLRRGSTCLRQPALLDGAAYQFANESLQSFFKKELSDWRPDVLWVDQVFSWPLVVNARHMGIPSVIRSQNFEPLHDRIRKGNLFLSVPKLLGKTLGELNAVRFGSVIAAITPKERDLYGRLGGNARTGLLPLRGLPECLRAGRIQRDRAPLKVFLSGGTYNVFHNREALAFVARELIPTLCRVAPGEFEFHILGGKVPADLRNLLDAHGAIVGGFVEDLNAFLDDMDIALCPSFSGAGMQQKVFEPLCRGFPAVISRRAIAGYPIEPGVHALVVDRPRDFAPALLALRSVQTRTHLARNASALCSRLFSASALEWATVDILRLAVTNTERVQTSGWT